MTTIRRTTAPTVSQPRSEPKPQRAAERAPTATGWLAKPSKARPTVAPAKVSPSAVQGNGPFPVSAKAVDAARASKDPKQMAEVLHGIAKDRSGVLIDNDATRVDRAKQLFSGMSPEQVGSVRAAYIKKYGMDPEHHIKSDDWGQPLLRLSRPVETELLGALNGPKLTADAKALDSMLAKAQAGTLTQADRKAYFSMLPMQGLWDTPVRQGANTGNLDSQERTLLKRAFGVENGSVSLDDALETIEARLPPAELTPKAPREKSIAAIASSHGAQWQELMDWAVKMKDQGYAVQIFTPEGRPVAIQRDSLGVASHMSGFGTPERIDPAGRAGELARELLGNAAPASKFDPKNFGAVYMAGGLGFNEDVAVGMPDGRGGSKLTANPNIASMMNKAVDEKLPIIGLCHGPTLLAAVDVEVNGKREPLNKGIETASLPPFEGYVGMTGRKEIQFTHDVNTHRALEAAGGETHVLKDVANMSRVVTAKKAGLEIITGPGPQAAANLADATVGALQRRWN